MVGVGVPDGGRGALEEADRDIRQSRADTRQAPVEGRKAVLMICLDEMQGVCEIQSIESPVEGPVNKP